MDIKKAVSLVFRNTTFFVHLESNIGAASTEYIAVILINRRYAVFILFSYPESYPNKNDAALFVRVISIAILLVVSLRNITSIANQGEISMNS
ncbi:hypothetical protein CAP31_09305 [Sulfuriferula sp. AH1]|nr:hypothetical protein CAP31_09305 [Sulfuriferula sp. AH1]